MPDEREEQLAKLKEELAKVVTAERFPETPTGRLWMEMAQMEINSALRDITSNKYEKDHMGYLKRLSDLQCYKRMVRRMQIAASPQLKQKLQEAIGLDEDGKS